MVTAMDMAIACSQLSLTPQHSTRTARAGLFHRVHCAPKHCLCRWRGLHQSTLAILFWQPINLDVMDTMLCREQP